VPAGSGQPPRHALTTDAAGCVCVWRCSDWNCLLKETGAHGERRIVSVAAHPSGRAALTLGEDGRLCLWDVARMKVAHTMELSGPKSLRRRRRAPSRLVLRPEGVAYSQDGTYFLVHDSDAVVVFSAESGAVICRLRHDSRVHVATFAPGGRDCPPVVVGCEDGTVCVWLSWKGRAEAVAAAVAAAASEAAAAESSEDEEEEDDDEDDEDDEDEASGVGAAAAAASARAARRKSRKLDPVLRGPCAKVGGGHAGSRVKCLVIFDGPTGTAAAASATATGSAAAARAVTPEGLAEDKIRRDDGPLPEALSGTGPVLATGTSGGGIALFCLRDVLRAAADLADVSPAGQSDGTDATGQRAAIGGGDAAGAVAVVEPAVKLSAVLGARLTCLAGAAISQVGGDGHATAGSASVAKSAARAPKRTRRKAKKAKVSEPAKPAGDKAKRVRFGK